MSSLPLYHQEETHHTQGSEGCIMVSPRVLKFERVRSEPVRPNEKKYHAVAEYANPQSGGVGT